MPSSGVSWSRWIKMQRDENKGSEGLLPSARSDFAVEALINKLSCLHADD